MTDKTDWDVALDKTEQHTITPEEVEAYRAMSPFYIEVLSWMIAAVIIYLGFILFKKFVTIPHPHF